MGEDISDSHQGTPETGGTEADRLYKQGDTLFESGEFELAAIKFRTAALYFRGEARDYRKAWEDGGKSELAYANELIKAFNSWFARNPMESRPTRSADTAVEWSDVRRYVGELMELPAFRALFRYFDETTRAQGLIWPNDMAANPLHDLLARYFGIRGRQWIDFERADLQIVIECFAEGIKEKVLERKRKLGA